MCSLIISLLWHCVWEEWVHVRELPRSLWMPPCVSWVWWRVATLTIASINCHRRHWLIKLLVPTKAIIAVLLKWYTVLHNNCMTCIAIAVSNIALSCYRYVWKQTNILCGQLICLVKLADVSTRCSSCPRALLRIFVSYSWTIIIFYPHEQ
jgi:hypothetical protein